ncbi:MAG: hypothetical protein M3383_08720 [Actinomycetota bacterium]|nr:hypothetical protein [Actinomycetota bacterium]
MNIKLPKPKTPSPARRQLTMPGPVEDLYRDMRDRRLLLPALLLLVAIIAVPVALSAQKSDPPAPLAFVPPKGAEAVAPAVLTEQPIGVRDYHERLAELKSKNPFAEKFKAPTAPDVGETSPTEAAAPAPADTGAPAPAPSVSPPAGGGDQPPADRGSDSSPAAPKTVHILLASRIDAFTGPRGDGRKIRRIEGGDLLPSKKAAPVVIFLGTNEALTEAKFIVSRDVTQTEGDGACRPSRAICEFLTMKKGEKRFFTFGPRDREYVLRVVDIYEVVVDREVQAR